MRDGISVQLAEREVVPLQLRQKGVIDLLPFFDLRWTQNFGISLGLFEADSVEARWILVIGTALIALGGLLPGIGGGMAKAGMVEALYVAERSARDEVEKRLPLHSVVLGEERRAKRLDPLGGVGRERAADGPRHRLTRWRSEGRWGKRR